MSKHLTLFVLGVMVIGLAGMSPGRAAAQDGQLKFEVYQDAKQEYRWRLKSTNGKILATAGQGFKSKRTCMDSVERIKESAGSDKYKTEIYQDNKQEHRWRLVASNGQTVCSSSQGYSNKSDCEKALDLIKTSAKKAKVEEVTE